MLPGQPCTVQHDHDAEGACISLSFAILCTDTSVLKHVLLLPEKQRCDVVCVLQMLPIVEQLANPALKDRHWRGVFTILGADRAVRSSSPVCGVSHTLSLNFLSP